MVIDGKASLSIKSLTRRASDVTAVLGLTPTAIAERGDPVGKLRTGADGKPSMRERSSSIWVLDAADSQTDDGTGLSSVHYLADALEAKREALATLRGDYFIEIRWSGFSDSQQGGFLIPAELMATLGSLGCDFHGTVYLTAEAANSAASAEIDEEDAAAEGDAESPETEPETTD